MPISTNGEEEEDIGSIAPVPIFLLKRIYGIGLFKDLSLIMKI